MIVNAAQAIADKGGAGVKGEISMSTAVEGGNAVVRITDNGCGIPDSIQDRILEPFFTTRDVGKGSGQGLAIAQSIVDKHNGTLSFESTVGEGATFSIALPLVAEPIPAIA